MDNITEAGKMIEAMDWMAGDFRGREVSDYENFRECFLCGRYSEEQ